MIPISGFNQKLLTLELMTTVSQLESFNGNCYMSLAWWLAKFVAKEAVTDWQRAKSNVLYLCGTDSALLSKNRRFAVHFRWFEPSNVNS